MSEPVAGINSVTRSALHSMIQLDVSKEMDLIGIATILAIPIYIVTWGLLLILSIRYRRKLKNEYPEECHARGGLRYLNGYLRRREYKDFGSDEFILESEVLRIFTKIWFFVFFTTMAILVIFFITHGRS